MMDDALLSRAFDVEEVSADFDPTVPPSTGLEYLQHVMYEASKCPQVMVANLDKKKIKNHVDVNVGLSENRNHGSYRPSPEWAHNQVAIFSEVRKKVERCRKSKKFKPLSLPAASDEEKWYETFFGSEKLEPSLTVMLSMNEPLVGKLLEYQLDWLEDELKPNQGKWLYALLACVDLPLTSDTCSVLRDLARECAKIRSQSVTEESNINSLSLIICLITKYFGQIDLVDL